MIWIRRTLRLLVIGCGCLLTGLLLVAFVLVPLGVQTVYWLLPPATPTP